MKYFLSILSIAFMLNTNAQITIEGVTLPATIKADGQKDLVLNGGGLREKFFLDLYVGGLYLESKSKDADAIIKADKPMAIRLDIISSLITSEKMIDAIDEGMENATDGKTEPIAKEIQAFKDAFSEEIKIDDVFLIVYRPKEGIKIYKNNKLVKTIKGLKFKQAVFGIWLCDDPADKDLKEGMLKG